MCLCGYVHELPVVNYMLYMLIFDELEKNPCLIVFDAVIENECIPVFQILFKNHVMFHQSFQFKFLFFRKVSAPKVPYLISLISHI